MRADCAHVHRQARLGPCLSLVAACPGQARREEAASVEGDPAQSVATAWSAAAGGLVSVPPAADLSRLQQGTKAQGAGSVRRAPQGASLLERIPRHIPRRIPRRGAFTTARQARMEAERTRERERERERGRERERERARGGGGRMLPYAPCCARITAPRPQGRYRLTLLSGSHVTARQRLRSARRASHMSLSRGTARTAVPETFSGDF